MGRANRLAGLTPSQLRSWLLLFFLALLIPSGVLIQHSHSQLKWEAFHQYRLQAEALSARINDRLASLVESEEQRRFADYAFLEVSGDGAAGFVQRSALSAFPVVGGVPGLVGYFQVDDAGRFSSPLLPEQADQAARYGIGATELEQRLTLHSRLQQILSQNRLVRGNGAPRELAESPKVPEREVAEAKVGEPLAEAVGNGRKRFDDRQEADAAAPPQAAFDRLSKALGKLKSEQSSGSAGPRERVEDLKLDRRFEAQLAEQDGAATEQRQQRTEPRGMRKERGVLPAPTAPHPAIGSGAIQPLPSQEGIRIHTFESELDPFEFSPLDSGHLVMFRKVWRDGRRFIQGLLIEQRPFLQDTVAVPFRESLLSGMSDLSLAYQGELIGRFRGESIQGYDSRAEELSGALLYRARLAAPLSDMELIYSVRQLPAGPGGVLLLWMTLLLLLVLCGGFWLLYRLGLRQIELARQQQDFVSAISHELKTPLTSIRMYGEMLREGWASEEKKRSYYDYIYDESERLTRLINNVLQLARMTRNGLVLECRPLPVPMLMEGIRAKIAALVERAGFELVLQTDAAAEGARVNLDSDAFSQIVINLVDNGLKFSVGATTRRIDITAAREGDGRLVFTVRDYGPGVPRDQMKKIFRLFYRSENELTRETIGTGIGLALVSQLAAAMGGRVDVVNRHPGAAFRIIFPVVDDESQCGE